MTKKNILDQMPVDLFTDVMLKFKDRMEMAATKAAQLHEVLKMMPNQDLENLKDVPVSVLNVTLRAQKALDTQKAQVRAVKGGKARGDATKEKRAKMQARYNKWLSVIMREFGIEVKLARGYVALVEQYWLLNTSQPSRRDLQEWHRNFTYVEGPAPETPLDLKEVMSEARRHELRTKATKFAT